MGDVVLRQGGGLTDTSTTAQYPLGFLYRRPTYDSSTVSADNANSGHQEWIYVKMTGGAATAGMVLARANGSTSVQVISAPTTSPAMRIVAVAQHAIAQDSFGFALKKGVGEVSAGAGAGYTANTALKVSTANAGTVIDVVDPDDQSIAFATEAAAAGETKTCFINCPG